MCASSSIALDSRIYVIKETLKIFREGFIRHISEVEVNWVNDYLKKREEKVFLRAPSLHPGFYYTLLCRTLYRLKCNLYEVEKSDMHFLNCSNFYDVKRIFKENVVIEREIKEFPI